jgi:acetyl coenzyme A synthetase (ADP forming)-like protein
MLKSSLKELFEPTSLALIGASSNPAKIGHEVLRNIIEGGYRGQVFPVNPRTPEILGLKTYTSVNMIPVPVDLAIVVIPSVFVPGVMKECAEKGVKAAVIISGGFREVGKEGKKLEESLAEIAVKSGIRIVGPNCQGVNVPGSGLAATFGGFARKSGSIAVVTQSGTVGAAIQCWAEREGIGISKCINLGNKIDVDEVDLIKYLEEDDDTKVITLYVEGLRDGRAFMDAALQVGRTKPIVLLKGGKTDAGMKAVLSHTASLAGNYEIFKAAMRQAGVITANSLEELYDFAKAFSLLRLPHGRGVLIIESTGGAGILAVDQCDRLGLLLPKLDEKVVRRLRQNLSQTVVFSNPFDLTSEALNPKNYRMVIEENSSNCEFHAYITIFGDPIPGAADILKEASNGTDKPIIVIYVGGGEVEEHEKAKMHSIGIPVFPSPERGVKTLGALVRYSKSLSNREERPFFYTM